MLSPERYQQAINTSGYYAKYYPNPDRVITTKQQLLDHHYRTEVALRRLSVTETEMPTSSLLYNEWIFPPTIPITRKRAGQLIIEIGGMPKIGKTTLIENALEFFRPPLNYVHEKVKIAVERAHRSSIPAVTEVIKSGMNIEALRNVILTEIGALPDSPTICERSYLDNVVWRRTLFITGEGKYPFSEQDLSVQKFTDVLEPSEINWVFVLCLAPPDLYFQRGGDKFTREFLIALFQQYLRLHYEIINNPHNFSYVCLDLSGGTVKNNQLFFNKMISRLTNLLVTNPMKSDKKKPLIY